jgi:DNA-binding HxlR family transcriptional regulator
VPRSTKPRAEHRSICPISSALDLLGDRWSLLVVRDILFAGARRFGDFVKSAEGIPTNILAERLARLERIGVIRRVPYQKRPVRYEYRLTGCGADLLPVLMALSQWSDRHIPGRLRPGRAAYKAALKVVAEAKKSGC